jgi:hypothetical protein
LSEGASLIAAAVGERPEQASADVRGGARPI